MRREERTKNDADEMCVCARMCVALRHMRQRIKTTSAAAGIRDEWGGENTRRRTAYCRVHHSFDRFH